MVALVLAVRPMSKELDTVALRELLAGASPLPWRTHDTWLDRGGYTAVVIRDDQTQPWSVAWLPTWSADPADYSKLNSWADAQLIAAAVNALPSLLATEAIVRDLAASDPLDSTGGCAHCGATLLHQPAPDTRHHDSCLWRRAVEWVRDSATQETEG
jgi:hypothetical protein